MTFLHSGESFGSAGVSRHLPDDVEQPAMEGAAQAAVFQPAEREVGAAMRAMPVDQAVAALLVAKQHQVFAEQFDRPDRARSRNSSTSAAGCQYIRISLPHGSFAPVRVIRSFCSWLIMAAFSGLAVQG